MKKGIILVVVIGVMLMLCTLALIALSLMTQQSRIAEHKIYRMRAFYAAQAGIVSALEELRRFGNVQTDPVIIGEGVRGYPKWWYPSGYGGGYRVNITYTADGSGPGGTNPVSATVNY